jgi:DNA ligase 1
VICKSLSPTAGYQAGVRGWTWIKLKRDYRTELSDTLDLVVVGGLAGRGRRAGMYGALLLAVYDAEGDRFQTICKCGTGFSDAELAALPARLAPLARTARPARVDSRWHADVWFEPTLVVEVLAAELTLSPTTPPAGASSRTTRAWRCGSPASPAAGARTRAPRTPPPSTRW